MRRLLSFTKKNKHENELWWVLLSCVHVKLSQQFHIYKKKTIFFEVIWNSLSEKKEFPSLRFNEHNCCKLFSFITVTTSTGFITTSMFKSKFSDYSPDFMVELQNSEHLLLSGHLILSIDILILFLHPGIPT